MPPAFAAVPHMGRVGVLRLKSNTQLADEQNHSYTLHPALFHNQFP